MMKPETKSNSRSEEVLPTSPSPISGIVLIMTLISAIAFVAMDYKDIGAWPELLLNTKWQTINNKLKADWSDETNWPDILYMSA